MSIFFMIGYQAFLSFLLYYFWNTFIVDFGLPSVEYLSVFALMMFFALTALFRSSIYEYDAIANTKEKE